MRRLLFVVGAFAATSVASVVFVGCKGTPTPDVAPAAEELYADSATIDSLVFDTKDTPMPKAADELFDDFIFNFATNSRLQESRIVFPLVMHKGNRTDTVSKSQWEMEHFFMEQDYYTLLFDSYEQMESVKDTSVARAIVEKIYLESGYVTQYLFARERGVWMMTSVSDTTYRATPNESFLTFYTRFVSDTLFQEASIANPLPFSGPDPDDDFATMEGVIMPEQWQMFAPELPKEMIYNIVYSAPSASTTEKLFVIRGIANGLETELLFRRREGRWKLVRLAM